jgi:hypothetical protein
MNLNYPAKHPDSLTSVKQARDRSIAIPRVSSRQETSVVQAEGFEGNPTSITRPLITHVCGACRTGVVACLPVRHG